MSRWRDLIPRFRWMEWWWSAPAFLAQVTPPQTSQDGGLDLQVALDNTPTSTALTILPWRCQLKNILLPSPTLTQAKMMWGNTTWMSAPTRLCIAQPTAQTATRTSTLKLGLLQSLKTLMIAQAGVVHPTKDALLPFRNPHEYMLLYMHLQGSVALPSLALFLPLFRLSILWLKVTSQLIPIMQCSLDSLTFLMACVFSLPMNHIKMAIFCFIRPSLNRLSSMHIGTIGRPMAVVQTAQVSTTVLWHLQVAVNLEWLERPWWFRSLNGGPIG